MKRFLAVTILCLVTLTIAISPASLAKVNHNSRSMSAAADVTYSFTIVNNTGYDIKELYFAPASSADWDRDDELLKGRLFKNGDSCQVTYNAKKNSDKWDMMCAWTDGSANSVWNAIDLNGASKLTMTYEKSSDTTYISRE
jgi:hypothetical protein